MIVIDGLPLCAHLTVFRYLGGIFTFACNWTDCRYKRWRGNSCRLLLKYCFSGHYVGFPLGASMKKQRLCRDEVDGPRPFPQFSDCGNRSRCRRIPDGLLQCPEASINLSIFARIPAIGANMLDVVTGKERYMARADASTHPCCRILPQLG